MGAGTVQGKVTEATMKRRFWQYATHEIDMSRDLASDGSLSKLGAHGWEAVTVVPVQGKWMVFLKREMDEKAAALFII